MGSPTRFQLGLSWQRHLFRRDSDRRWTRVVVLAAMLAALASCSKTHLPSERVRPSQRFSSLELAAVDALDPSQRISLVVHSGAGEIREMTVRAKDARLAQEQVLSGDPEATVIVDYRSAASPRSEEPVAYQPDEALLFGGKQEFGFDVWDLEHPEADGRGVVIGVVDDGVALARPGLEVTSTGKAKIIRSLNLNREWQLPLSSDAAIDLTDADPKAKVLASSFALDLTAVPEVFASGMRGHLFTLSGCGIRNARTRKPRFCESWEDLLGSKKSAQAIVTHDEKASPDSIRVAVDFDQNGKITAEEVFRPLSVDAKSIKMFSNGSALAFDVTDAGTLGLSDLDTRTRVLTVAVPQASRLSAVQSARGQLIAGSHGEGVAGVAAGFRIAGRPFNGVAPGAQIVDVHFTDPVGENPYTISEIARALKAAGKVSDVVNLSYSLFFNSPAAQVAMGRFLEEALRHTSAVYLFSAGNNGPGVGSMNRALLYPSFGIPVAAFLNGTMAQSTFGSAVPMGIVAPYSSVGPGLDGASGAVVLSPLAGIVPSTADDGFRPFSGTSSATPAMAGFVARLISELRAEKLPVDRAKIRASLVAGAEPIAGAAFIEQGYGIPKLKSVLADYRKRIASKRMIPMRVQGATNAYGVTRRGIYVRDGLDRADQYSFSISPVFDSSFSEADRANFTERVDLSSAATFIQFPKSVLVPREGVSINVAIDWDQVQARGPGLVTSQIELRSSDRSETLGVIPVTIIVPHTSDEESRFTVEVRTAEPTRIFLKKPDWASHLVIAREVSSGGIRTARLCGRAALYNPSAVRSSMQVDSVKADGTLEEYAFETPGSGVYEWVVEGRNNHQACPRKQTQSIRFQWVQASAVRLDSSLASGAAASNVLSGRWALLTRAPSLLGSVRLEGLYAERILDLISSTSGFYTQVDSVDLSMYLGFQFKLDDSMAEGRQSIVHYPYFGLAVASAEGVRAPISIDANDFGQIGGLSASGRFETDEDKKEFASSKLEITAFESGIDSSDLPRLLKVEMIGQLLAPVQKTGTNIRMVEVRAGQPTFLDYSFSALDASTAATMGLMSRCRFVPRGFLVAVPCGWVRF